MNNCKNCGAPLQPGYNICPSCGTPLNNQPMMNNQMPQQPMYQQPYQQPMYQQPYQQPANDSGSIGWGILGFFFPIVGWVLYFVWKDTKPNSANAAGVGGLIGFILGVILVASGAV